MTEENAKSNMRVYSQACAVPFEAQKTIKAGRLKGMTDINPMWRIKKLTELFGPCGKGWYIDIAEQNTIPAAKDEVLVFVTVHLFIKELDDKEWSKPIIGTGGSKLTTKENSGLYNSDDCYKKAATDAIGNACKLLGIGGNVWFQQDQVQYPTQPMLNKMIEDARKNGIEVDFATWVKSEFQCQNVSDITLIQFNIAREGLDKKIAKIKADNTPVPASDVAAIKKAALERCIDEAKCVKWVNENTQQRINVISEINSESFVLFGAWIQGLPI